MLELGHLPATSENQQVLITDYNVYPHNNHHFLKGKYMSRSKKRRFNIINSFIFILSAFILFGITACGDQDGGVATLTLTADPASLPADGYSQSLLQATLVMADGEEVRDQTEVKFSIVKGEGKISKTSRTTGGVAHAILTSSENPGTATIRATAQGSIAEITVNYDDSGPAIITMADGFPDPASVNIAGTGGQDSSLIVWNVSDTYGNPVGDGFRVDFEIIKGPGAGETLEPISATTRQGQVSTLLRSGSKSGPVTIKATYHDDSSISNTSNQIAINGGPPAGEEFGIFPETFNILGLRYADAETPISVNVGDIYGNAVPDGTVISFKTYNTGGIISPNMDTTSGGFAQTTLISGGTYAKPSSGFVSVTAETDGSSTTHVRTIAVDPQNSNIMYVGTSGGGVYKSNNGGSSWENVSRTSEHENLGQNFIDPYVNDICIDPDNPETIYVATGYEGKGNIYRSLNGGITWNSNNNPAEWGGLLRIESAVLTILCDDGSDYVWAGTRNAGIVFSRNGKSFFSQDGGAIQQVILGSERTVRDIKKASGTGTSATLYAATPTGVYKTVNGGSTWTRVTDFTGDNITTLAVHPDDPNTIYAGTQEYGVWYSTNGGNTWTRYASGLGTGLKATTPVADGGNIGSGLMSDVLVGKNTKTETWTVVYDGESERWTVTGTASGKQKELGITGQTYTSDKNEIEFRIMQGSTLYENGDTFRFQTVRDTGMNIKDLQVYHSVSGKAYYLYAITYAFGSQEYYAVGNVYSVALDSGAYYKPKGVWQEANMNLPEIDPPTNNALLAQHALAVDKPRASTRLFIGGEGINFYKAVSGLNQGDPVWEQSKIGLTNKIMARIPILFSGQAYMFVEKVEELEVVQIIEDEETVYWRVVFEVYIGDSNGNPPIQGSEFTVTRNGETLVSIEYPDTLAFTGSWNDPSDPNPYVIEAIIQDGESGAFTFEFTQPDFSDQQRVIPYNYEQDESVE